MRVGWRPSPSRRTGGHASPRGDPKKSPRIETEGEKERDALPSSRRSPGARKEEDRPDVVDHAPPYRRL